MDHIEDYYEILGVSEQASAEEIKRAYHQQAYRSHPDSRSEPLPTTLFHSIHAAYAVLSDPDQRRAYDQQRLERKPDPEPPLEWDAVLSSPWLYARHDEQVAYLMLKIQPGAEIQVKRLPLNLCLVIDRSTSMQGARLDYVKAAAREIIAGLQDDDALAIVTFSDRAQVVLPSQIGGDWAAAKARILSIQVGGGTEILQGLQAGLARIRQRHSDSVTSHLILLTDGHTYGDEQACLAEAQQAGAEHIRITTVGIGEDWNDAMLDGIANHSGGISTYASDPSQVRGLLQHAVRGLGNVFAQGIRLLPHCAANVQVENAFCIAPSLRRLLMGPDGAIEIGTLEGEGPLAVVLKLSVKGAEVGERLILQPELIADVPTLNLKDYRMGRNIFCTFTPAEPPAVPAPSGLVSALNRVTLYTMQEQAWAALERGDSVSATDRLKMVSLRLHDMGAAQLAEAAMLEAGRIAAGGDPSPQGRKQLKYGTRSLGSDFRGEQNG